MQCVPSTLVPRQRRRRFAERDLLDRLRHYENLLRENNIIFDPLHPGAAAKNTPSDDETELQEPIDGLIEATQRLTTSPSDAAYVSTIIACEQH